MKPLFTFFGILAAFALPLHAHDLWVQTNTNTIPTNDVIHIDLMLGNHGNNHRDFKLAGKADLATLTVHLTTPDQKKIDLKPAMKDMGHTPNEGFWSAKYFPEQTGLYTVSLLSDAIMSYAPIRSIRSARTFFGVVNTLQKPPNSDLNFDKPMGAPLELVPATNPVMTAERGGRIKAQLLFNQKPLINARIAFIPRGETLKEGFDKNHESRTDENGFVSFEIHEPNYYLMVAQHMEEERKGPGYNSTHYSATLTVYVP